MATLGSQPGGFNYYLWYGSGGEPNQVATDLYTMPVDGWVSSVSFYADSYSGTTEFTWVVWDSSGNVLTNGGPEYIGSGSQSVGGQSWQTQSTGFLLKAGTQVRIGWWRAESGSMLFSRTASGNGYTGSNQPGSPGSLGSLSGLGGQIGAYLTYTQVSAPSVTTQAATSVTPTSAQINGTVNDNGWSSATGGSTSWDFNWNTSPSGGTPAGGGTFTGSTGVSTTLTGLSPSTTYYFQVAAWNSEGTTDGSWVGFTTPAYAGAPSATTGSASSITTTSANLAGSVNDNGFAANGGGSTNWQILWNTSASPSGATVAASGTFTGSANETGAATGLPSATTLYFAIVSFNSEGTTYGSWVSFTTLTPVTPPTTTLVSPPNAFATDISGAPTFTWQHNPHGGGAETGWSFEAAISGGPFLFWNATSLAWQTTLVINSGSIQSYTFPAGTFAPRVPILWSAATQDSGGYSGFAIPYSVLAPSQPAAAPTVGLPGTGHVACSAAYLDQLTGNDLYVAAVAEVWLGGVKQATFQVDPASQGVTVERSQSTRRCASVTLTEGAAWGPNLQPVRVVPQTQQDVFLPYGAEVVLYSGLYFAGGQDQIYDPSTGLYQAGELIQLGVFGINDETIDHTGPNLVVTLDLFDRAKAVTRAGFIEDTQLPLGVEIGAAIQQVCTTVNGGLPTGWTFVFNFQNSGALTPSTAIVWKAGDDPFAQMRSLANSCGFDLYFDPTGTLCFLPIPNPWQQPIFWTYQPGELNLSTENARTASRENAPNYIIRLGQDANDNPVGGVAIDQNPLSPTYLGGSYGRQVDCQTSPLVRSNAQGQAAANAALLLALGTIEAIDLKASVGRPDTDVDGVVSVLDPVAGIVTASLYVIDSFTLNFGSAAILEITQARAIASILDPEALTG
jgi:hypothetical protein